MAKKYVLSIDLGASSGRHIVCEINSNEIQEIYRFKHQVVENNGHKFWDIKYLWNEIKEGIKIACEHYDIVSLGIDTWAVDYVLLDENGDIGLPYAYRDSRTQEVINAVHNKISFKTLYSITGIQFQPFNTIYQLYSDKIYNKFKKPKKMLMLPAYFYYKLTGEILNEYTNATSTGLVDLKTKTYSEKILKALGYESSWLPEIKNPGYIMEVLPEIREELGFNGKAILVATHDTASAVEGIDIGCDKPYLSSGTWSLLGIKVKKPIISNRTRALNYSHEGGINYLRFQKNIMGLWIIEELMRELKISSYDEIVEVAKQSTKIYLFNVNDERLLAPVSMKLAVENIIQFTYKIDDVELSDLVNAVYHSLARSYRETIEVLEEMLAVTYDKFYIFGGGTKNEYLNQLIETYTHKQVVVLSSEATALGNIKIQKESLNHELY